MLRLLKSVLAEVSYFFEKYFGADSIVWSMIFLAFCCAVIVTSVMEYVSYLKAERKKEKKSEEPTTNKKKNRSSKFAICTGVMTALTYIVNYLVAMAYTWDSKLQRVMSNFQYVLSFPSNRHSFLFALGLPDNTTNKNNLFQMALYLNSSQWNKVFKNAGESAWYFKKVKKAMFKILHIKGCHLMLNPLQQGWIAYLPFALMMVILAVMLTRKPFRKWWVNIAVMTAACVSCLFINLGASIFMISGLLFGLIWSFLLRKAIVQVGKDRKEEREKNEKKEEQD